MTTFSAEREYQVAKSKALTMFQLDVDRMRIYVVNKAMAWREVRSPIMSQELPEEEAFWLACDELVALEKRGPLNPVLPSKDTSA